MIDTLRTLAQPYSHWLMSHRDVTIVVMGLFLMWTTGQALLTYWRMHRLTRDLSATRTDSRAVVRRSYTPPGVPASKAAAVEAESATGLPPVRGGRTYARNLGNALQKAGMAPAAPVYSPPTPVGWGPGPNAAPGRPAPAVPPTYSPPQPPWASPASQPSGPRPMPAPATPSPWPTYVPPGGPGLPPIQAPQPAPPYFGGAPGQPSPAIAQPPSAPSAPYAMPASPSTAPAAPPQFGGVTLSEPVPPPLPTYSPPGQPVQAISPAPAEAAPSKPKRKRFSLQVLQNLEKTLQRTTGLGTATPVAEPPVPAPSAPPSMAPVSSAAPAQPAEPLAPVEEPEAAVSEAEEVPASPPEPEAPAWQESEAATAKEPEPAPWKEAEPPVSDTRAAMRAMLFGEDEKTAATQEPEPVEGPTPQAEEEVFRFEPVAAEPSAESAPVVEPAAPTSEPVGVEPVEMATDIPEPTPMQWEMESDHQAAEHSEPALVSPEPPAETDLYSAPPADHPAAGQPAAAPEDVTPPVPLPAGTGGDRGRLVIIEDDTAVAEYYATLFRGNGWDVHVAGDGISGVDLCSRVQPNVILLDVMMPRQNGMLVLQTLRASDETKETPVVVLSNFSEPTLIKRALQLGALEYVIKTQVEGAALLEAMPRWMNREKVFAAA